MIRKGVLRGRDILIQCDSHVIEIAAPVAGWVMNNLDIVAGAYAYALAQEAESPTGLPTYLDANDPAFIAAVAAHHNKLILNLLNNLATGGGVAVAMRHVSTRIVKILRDNLALLRHHPAALPTWSGYVAQLPPPHINPIWQGQIAGPDPLQEIQHHQAPAWQQAVAPQPAQHVPAAAWFPVVPQVPHQHHQQHPVVPVVPNLHHIGAPPAQPVGVPPAQHIAAPVQHIAPPVQPGAGPRPQVPLPPHRHGLQVAPPPGPPAPVAPGDDDPGDDDPVAAAAAARLQRLAADRAKYAANAPKRAAAAEAKFPGKAGAQAKAKQENAEAKAKATGARAVVAQAKAHVAQAKADTAAQYLVQYPAKATPKAVQKAATLANTAAKAGAAAAKAGVAAANARAAAAKAGAVVPPAPPPPAAGGSRPRRAKLKINNSNLLMPFHDITDDPYFIRV